MPKTCEKHSASIPSDARVLLVEQVFPGFHCAKASRVTSLVLWSNTKKLYML